MNILFSLSLQFDVRLVQEVADDHFTPEFISTLGSERTWGVNVYVEQQQGQYVTLV